MNERHLKDNRLEERLDAVLHLLDRQIVDSEDAFVGKVDDIELTEDRDGTLRATGLLLGPAALVPRLGGDHDRDAQFWWQRLKPARADRPVPGRIDIDLVRHLGSEVTLHVERDGVVHLQGPAPEGTTHRRVGDLLGLRVLGPDGKPLPEHVVDVRLEPDVAADDDNHPQVRSLLVGRSRPGSLMGYDRASVTRPVLVAKAFLWLNRHTAELSVDDVDPVDWADRTVRARSLPQPLQQLGTR